MPEPFAPDEAARLEALRRYGILDTAPEAAFDRIAALARAVFGVPVAAVSFLDETRQWLKARVGTNAAEVPRPIAFCDYTIRGDDVMVVPDAAQDPRFSTNPLVTDGPRFRFYAGAPILGQGGHRIGTVCVLGPTPRWLSDGERASLHALAGIARHELELRARTQEVERLAEERAVLLREIDHRLQNSLMLVSHALEQQARDDASPAVRRALRAAADRLVTVALVSRDLRAPGDDGLSAREYVLALCDGLGGAFVDGPGGRKLVVDVADELPVPPGQRPRLGFIIAELVGNAVKHGQGSIALTVDHPHGHTRIRIRDEGLGYDGRLLRPEPDWGDGLRLVSALCGGQLWVDPADRHTLHVLVADAGGS